MRKDLTSLVIAIIIVTLVIYAYYPFNESKIKWYDFNNGLEIAKAENKKILINVYADWCKWCKKLENEVFPDPEVMEYMLKRFISIKFNGEDKNKINYMGQIYLHSEFVEAFGINGFPATIFMTSEAEPITVLPGYLNAKEYLLVLKFIGEDLYLKMTYDEYLNSLK